MTVTATHNAILTNLGGYHSATLYRKSSASSAWDSAGNATWTAATVTSFVCRLQPLRETFLREQTGIEAEQRVKIFMPANISVLRDDIISDTTAGRDYQADEIDNRFGHVRVIAKYFEGARQR